MLESAWLLLRLLWVFTKVAMLTWGGGPASMALMQRMSVAEGWSTETEYADALAIGNALPGPIAPKIAGYIGYKVAGVSGATAAIVGSVLPTSLLMILAIFLFFQIKDSPTVSSMLKAVRPVVVGMLLWTTYDIGRSVFWKKGMQLPDLWQRWDGFAIAIITFIILTFTKVNPAFVVLGAAVAGWLIYRK